MALQSTKPKKKDAWTGAQPQSMAPKPNDVFTGNQPQSIAPMQSAPKPIMQSTGLVNPQLQAPPNQSIKVGDKNLEVNGQTISKKDYQSMIDVEMRRGGTLTPQTQALMDKNKEESQFRQYDALYNAKQSKIKWAQSRGLLDPNLIGQTEVPQVPTLENIRNQEIGNITTADQMLSNASNEYSKSQETYTEGMPLLTSAGKEFGKEMTSAAQLYDGVHSFLKGTKPLSTRNAQDEFSKATSTLTQSIDLIKMGAGDPIQAQRDLQAAASALNSLEITTQGLSVSKANLNWWVDDGKLMQASVINEKRIIENMRVDLANAISQNKYNEMTQMAQAQQAGQMAQVESQRQQMQNLGI